MALVTCVYIVQMILKENGSCDTNLFWKAGIRAQSLSKNGLNYHLPLAVHHKIMGFIIEVNDGSGQDDDVLKTVFWSLIGCAYLKV